MITHFERSAHVDIWQRALLARASDLIARVSDARGDELRCHELARAVAECLGLAPSQVVDGRLGHVAHSWIRLGGGVVLDVYAPGRLPCVQLVSDHRAVADYLPGPTRADVDPRVVDDLIREMIRSGQ